MRSASDLWPSLSGIHVPADVYQLVAAPHKHLGRAAARSAALPFDVGLENVSRVDEHRVAIDLNLCLGELELHEFPTILRKSLRTREDLGAGCATFSTVMDRDPFFPD